MTCHSCRIICKKFGKHRNGLQRFRCNRCRKTFTEDHERPLDEMRLPLDRAVNVLQLLLEGMSIRSVERVTDVHRDTILRLLVLAGNRCERLMRRKIEYLPVKDVEVDEVWGFVQKKEAQREAGELFTGDAWCYVAIERNTKLVLAWHLGRRNRVETDRFLNKLRYATSPQRFQITTDGFLPYAMSVPVALEDRTSYAQIIKVYRSPREGEQRYSPGEVVNTEVVPFYGRPDPSRVCTSHVERQNLSIRMGMRRMTRLTNAFSKKWENLEAAYALWFAFYNFCRVHRSIRVTPAMEAGLTSHPWAISELINA